MIKELFILILCFSCLVSCGNQNKDIPVKYSKLNTVNDLTETQEILKVLYDTDQEDRSLEKINWSQMSKNDKKRLRKVKELLIDSNKLTALDYSRAAMIFQHGGATKEYKTAIELMEKAIELDSSIDSWLYFAATDRYLMSMEKPQIFGTQYTYSDTGKVIKSMDRGEKADSIRSSYTNLPPRIKESLISLNMIFEE